MSLQIIRDIAYSASKGCALFLQLGTSALIWQPSWAKHRDVAYIKAEIDTPFQRLQIQFCGRKKANSPRYRRFVLAMKSNQQGSGYRDRWLKKLGHIS